MTNLRAGLVGLGVMGRNHARVLASLEGVDLVGCVDPAGGSGGTVSAPILETLDELISLGIDYCVVAVPTGGHEALALQLAEAEVHALIEKPLAEDFPASLRIVTAFESRGLIGAVGHIERYNAAIQSARQRIQAGEIGLVYQIATRRQGPFPGRIADVGVVKDLATHDIDLTAWVSQQRFVQVSGQIAHRSGRPHEDLVSASGLLSGGAITSHIVNWLTPFKERKTIITGETGTLVADTLTADLTLYRNGSIQTVWQDISHFRGVSEGDVVRFAIAKPEPLRREHEIFRDALLGSANDIVTLRQGAENVRVAEAMLESAATNKVVQIEEAL